MIAVPLEPFNGGTRVRHDMKAGGNRLMTVVAIKTQYLGHSKQAGLIASQCAGAVEMNRLTVVVDDHVDVTNLQDVVWAILARCDPERGVDRRVQIGN